MSLQKQKITQVFIGKVFLSSLPISSGTIFSIALFAYLSIWYGHWLGIVVPVQPVVYPMQCNFLRTRGSGHVFHCRLHNNNDGSKNQVSPSHPLTKKPSEWRRLKKAVMQSRLHAKATWNIKSWLEWRLESYLFSRLLSISMTFLVKQVLTLETSLGTLFSWKIDLSKKFFCQDLWRVLKSMPWPPYYQTFWQDVFSLVQQDHGCCWHLALKCQHMIWNLSTQSKGKIWTMASTT